LIYVFDSYQLDGVNCTLARDGRRLPLEPKALQVLLLLVRHAGQLIRKETFFSTIWHGTVVEESSLSRAIALIRRQVGDDSRKPRYIETVPTLGFRFIGKVTQQPGVPAPAVFMGVAAADPPDILVPPVSPPAAAGSRSSSAQRSILNRSIVFLGLALCAIGGWVAFRHRARPPLPPQAIVLAEFVNKTGDAVFDDTLRQGLSVQLEQSPFLHLVSEQRVRQTLVLMGLTMDARLTDAVSRDVCLRTDSAAVLHGSIVPLEDHYVLGLDAVNCRTGEPIDREQTEVSHKHDVLAALTDMARRLRTRLGESTPSVSRYDVPLSEATTPSLDALKAFSQADRVNNVDGPASALPVLRRATEIDPHFAMAHALAARLYGDLGQEAESVESATAAYQNRERATEKERFWIVASYEMQVTGNMTKALETCETWSRIFPDDEASYGLRAGLIFRELGQYENAMTAASRALALNPDLGIGYHLVAVNEMALEHYAEAHRALDDAERRGIHIPVLTLDRYRLAFLEKNDGEKARALSASSRPNVQMLLANQEAATWAFSGRLKASRKSAQQAQLFALQAGQLEAVSRFEAAAALREAFYGNAAAAADDVQRALSHSKGRDAQYGAAFALALIGRTHAAEELALNLQTRYPENTSVLQHYLPTLRAAIALSENQPALALQMLSSSGSVDMGMPQSGFTGYYGTLYPILLRGRALQNLGRPAEAAREFEKITGHPGMVVNDPVGSIAYLDLARASRFAGDVKSARAAYSTVLGLWDGADDDVAMIDAARRESSAIQ
jgi:DNA-binding winged helix-turn-helix (wHTH) protein/tetratricopeptide (TPR) repeat protein